MPRKVKSEYARVTSVLGSLNTEWKYYWAKSVGFEECERISRESTSFGRQVHSIVENHLVKKPLEKESTEREKFCGNLLIKWIEEAGFSNFLLNEKPSIEVELKSEKYKLIGHADCFGSFKNDPTLWVIDWKTSKEVRIEYPLQLAAYAYMLEEQYGLVCNDGVIIRTPSDPNAKIQFEPKEFHNLREKYWPVFLDGLRVYNYFHGR